MRLCIRSKFLTAAADPLPHFGIYPHNLQACNQVVALLADFLQHLSLKGARHGPHAQWAAARTLHLTAKYPHQITHCTKLHVCWCFGVLLINKHHFKRIGVKRLSGWWDVHLGHVLQEKSSKWVPKWFKYQTLPNLGLEHPISISNIIEVYRWVLGVKGALMDSWWGHTFAIYAKIGQKQRLGTHAGHQGRLLHPKVFQKPSYMIKVSFTDWLLWSCDSSILRGSQIITLIHLQVLRAYEASTFKPLVANSMCEFMWLLLRCNMLRQGSHSPFSSSAFKGYSSTPLCLCCSSIQHMCALAIASSHAYLYDHHACTWVGHSPIAPSQGMKPL